MTKTTVYNATGGVVAKWDGGASHAGMRGPGDPNDILGAIMFGGHMVTTDDEGVYVYSMRCELLPKWARIATPDVAQTTDTESTHKGEPDDRD